ncbi:MAG: cell division topological specificity factor MinE [Pelotomaculum sp.]|uniref:Cell division topological specificity factor n=1 Tax=Pelotomaculum thermopropionicum (strain DSM 13744 / JCM 10971 / SI) TaxID=370438 RepID=MINE_PELTS|nr:RecName: Full=Cell division topological specificity factor [Pelotomaculum thermopropionicum SI]NPV73834.1 cell division topological specificity factor MinE [Pelotomaculum sp.]BAF59004.1 septum formation topological specificity factor [Pelotomaculum thermopropionicum SI]
MLEFLTRLFSKDGGSKNVAKERLRLVLVHDRTSISPQLLETLKAELIKVISNYMEIDEAALEVSLDSSGNTVALVASIPVKGMKRVAGTA